MWAAKASSHSTRAASRRTGRWAVAVVAEGPGQEVDAQVQPHAGGRQVLDLPIGLEAPDIGGKVDGGQVGDAQAQAAAQLADDDLGHEHPQALPAPRNFIT